MDNEQLLERIKVLETKVDHLVSIMEQANGVVSFLKWAAGVGAAIAGVYAALKGIGHG